MYLERQEKGQGHLERWGKRGGDILQNKLTTPTNTNRRCGGTMAKLMACAGMYTALGLREKKNEREGIHPGVYLQLQHTNCVTASGRMSIPRKEQYPGGELSVRREKRARTL